MKSETGGRWLVVENDEQALETVATLLGAFSSAEIWTFQSAWEALEAFAAAPEPFDLVITDFDMPGMNGVDFRRHMHALAPGLKVFLITGSGVFGEEAAERSGFCGLLRKPFTLSDLKRAVEYARARPIARTALCGAI